MAERKHEQEERSQSADLKEREYRDKEGNVHHHTHEFMERHKGEKRQGGSERNESGQSRRDEK